MPPKAAVDDFDDDTDFDLPTIGSASASAASAAPQPGQHDQMAAFQKMMEQMQMGQQQQQTPNTGDFGASRPPPALAKQMDAAAGANDEHKKCVSVYPIYFDAKRHYGKGCRRVAYDKACPFPTALWIAKALARMNVRYVAEPYKTHPQDWENPGRVKVQLFNDDASPAHAKLGNKKQLFDAIAEILQPNCGGKPPALEPRKKRTKPAAYKAAALAENKEKRAAAAAAGTGGGSTSTSSGGKAGKKATSKSGSAAAAAERATRPVSLTRKQRDELARLRRDPNPNPIRSRLAAIKFPPRLEDRLPEHSPALEGGVLNMNLAEAMGGPGGGGAGGMMDQLGPLGGMLGGMGLGGGDDDDEDDDEEAQQAAAAEADKKKNDKQMPNLSRRQKKKVVRIGR